MPTRTTDYPMTADEIQAVLNRVTYRSGWKFRYAPDQAWSGSGGYLTITGQVEDTYHLGQVIPITHGTPMPPFWRGEDDLLRWVGRWLSDSVERHESREWFKVDGAIFDDPHKVRS